MSPTAIAFSVASSLSSCLASAISSETRRCASLITEAIRPRGLKLRSVVAASKAGGRTRASLLERSAYWPYAQAFVKAGFDHVYVHQVVPDQEGLMRFYEQEVFPRRARSRLSPAARWSQPDRREPRPPGP